MKSRVPSGEINDWVHSRLRFDDDRRWRRWWFDRQDGYVRTTHERFILPSQAGSRFIRRGILAPIVPRRVLPLKHAMFARHAGG